MQFLKLVSLQHMQWKNKSEMDERMGIMSVKGEDHQVSKITQENISATVKYAKSSLLRLTFQGFFSHIRMPYEITILLL